MLGLLGLLAKNCDQCIGVLKIKQQVRTIFAAGTSNWRKPFAGKKLHSALLRISGLIVVGDAFDLSKPWESEFDARASVVCGADVFDGDED